MVDINMYLMDKGCKVDVSMTWFYYGKKFQDPIL